MLTNTCTCMYTTRIILDTNINVYLYTICTRRGVYIKTHGSESQGQEAADVCPSDHTATTVSNGSSKIFKRSQGTTKAIA